MTSSRPAIPFFPWLLTAAAVAVALFQFQRDGFWMGALAVFFLWWAERDRRMTLERSRAEAEAKHSEELEAAPLSAWGVRRLLDEWGRLEETWRRVPMGDNGELHGEQELLAEELLRRKIKLAWTDLSEAAAEAKRDNEIRRRIRSEGSL